MNTYKTKLFTQTSINSIFVTGILGFLIHPFVLFGYKLPDLGFLAWFFLVPLVLGIHRYQLKDKIILCFLSGLVTFFGLFYWLMTAMQCYGKLNFFAAFSGLTLLCVVLSLFFAVFLGVTCWVHHVVKIPLFILLPLFMLTKDFILSRFPFEGFPWGMVAYSQGEWIRFFQWVDVTGVFGLGFLIYLINGLFADGLLLLIHRKQLDKMVSRFLVVFVLSLFSLYASFSSSQRHEKIKEVTETINVALVQGNIPQSLKWDPYKAQDNLNTYLRLTNLAVKDHATVVFWPESAYPYGIRKKSFADEQFLDKTQLLAPVLFGAIFSQTDGTSSQIFNSIIYADTTAHYKSLYHKIHLVPFGEYLPFKKYFSFIPNVTRVIGEFTPGTEHTLFDIAGYKFGSLICFEDVFADLAQHATQAGADILVNYTNDAWYGNSSAMYQHLVFSQFRALENRRFLLRATNTGITALISARGLVVDQLPPFKDAYLLTPIKAERGQAYYTEHGDAWVKIVVMLCAGIFLYAALKCSLGPVKIRF